MDIYERLQGTREIRVILYAKDDPFCATALADELPIEDKLAVEHDIVPFDWAVCSRRERLIPLACGSHSLACTFRAAQNLPHSGSSRLCFDQWETITVIIPD